MAQTKKRAAPKRSSSKGKSTAAKARSSSKSSPGNGSQAAAGRAEVEDKAKGTGQAVGKAASKAKVPLIAGGAAIAGATAGIALASRQDRHRRLAMAMRKPRIELTSKDVAKAAKEVGRFSAQMGELATELRRSREGDGKQRSPLEVLLHGLTTRR